MNPFFRVGLATDSGRHWVNGLIRRSRKQEPRGAAMLIVNEAPVFSAKRQDIYRLRDDVYVLEEDSDQEGRIYHAYVYGELVGSMSVKYPWQDGFGECLREWVDAAELEDAAVAGKLHVARGQRASTMAYQLAEASFLEALHSGIRYLVQCSEKWLVPFYQRLGYQVHEKREVRSSCSGSSSVDVRSRLAPRDETMVLVLDLHDEENLSNVQSPFLKFLEDWKGVR
jgi:hypothetical protein